MSEQFNEMKCDDKIFKGKLILKNKLKTTKKNIKQVFNMMSNKKEGKNMKEHPAKAVYEQIAGLKRKLKSLVCRIQY